MAWSLPAGERGLKFKQLLCEYDCIVVAPRWGAGIEIIGKCPTHLRSIVAPRWGAGIEIEVGISSITFAICRSPLGSGD